MQKIIISAIFLFGAAILALTITDIPKEGQVLTYRGENQPIGSATALLLRSHGCLVVSRSKEDIGKRTVPRSRSSNLYQVALGPGVKSWKRGNQIGLESADGTKRLSVGQAFDAELAFRPKRRKSFVFEVGQYGWLTSNSCGEGVAIITKIDRVHEQLP